MAGLRARRPSRLDPGDHLHQQGRRRDEGPGRVAGRPAGAGDVGQHLPLRLRPDPPQGDRHPRVQVQLLHLRRRGLQAADDDGRQGPRARPQAPSARRPAPLDVGPQERAARRRGGHPRRPQRLRGVGRRGLHGVPEAAARGQRARLRRPDHVHGPPLPGPPGRPGDLPPPVPPRPGRRVPGHQPRPVRAGPPAERRRPGGPRPERGAGRAERADGGGRPRPVDLRLAGRQHPQHPRLRTGLPRRGNDHAGAELPLDPAHPERRRRRDRRQQRAQAQAAVVGQQRRRADLDSAPTTSTTRPTGSANRSTA